MVGLWRAVDVKGFRSHDTGVILLTASNKLKTWARSH